MESSATGNHNDVHDNAMNDNDMNNVYQQYAQSVYRFLLSKTRNEDLAEELTQETFYQAIKSINRYDGSCKFAVYDAAIGQSGYQRIRIAL